MSLVESSNVAPQVELGRGGGLPPPRFDAQRDILYEDETCVIVHKAPGLYTHRNHDAHRVPALADDLAQYFDFDQTFFEPPSKGMFVRDTENIDRLRRGIVHRLDHETSGLILCAKTYSAEIALKKLFKKRRVAKKYYALVHGLRYEGTGRLENDLARDLRPRFRMQRRVVPSGMGKHAVTLYTACEFFENVSLVDIELITGRTHQIRVQFAHLGSPVLGDRLYGDKNLSKKKSPTHPLGNDPFLYLHAYALAFTHPLTGKDISLEADLPDFFEEKLKALRSVAS